MKKCHSVLIAAISLPLLSGTLSASEAVPDKANAQNTDGGGYGPQAPVISIPKLVKMTAPLALRLRLLK